ncbi:hypothetical protein BZG82_15625 [Salinivibrio sp. PR5]|uniref:glycosyltransferase n=1 Tax=Salinivibrio sp. PR5 TaxID=1909484 RepID=UPI00098B6DDC|nr:glycosyltransferase [Salinivibrio sp. PR5]OOF08028.1 hypothetical protein BZG82_15625 [Salinivibrio sp. PR5]
MNLSLGNSFTRVNQWDSAAQHYIDYLPLCPDILRSSVLFNLAYCLQRVPQLRLDDNKVAVCSWELSHNPAGRAVTLAEAYATQGQPVDIIGCLFTRWGGTLWPPISNLPFSLHTFQVSEENHFIEQAIEFVLHHPYQRVHLSKPRLPNLVLGCLYEWIWGADIVVDIDDEELGFSQSTETEGWDALQRQGISLPELKNLHNGRWTRLSVAECLRWPVISVSNPALQARYGGHLLPHVRDEKKFYYNPQRYQRSRKALHVAAEQKVVMFCGTPRRHKGLLETARAIAQLQRSDVVFMIVGDFDDPTLKQELLSIKDVEYRFLANQDYFSLPDVLAAADVCVLMQSSDSMVAEYQLPAKMVDAIGLGISVLAQVTPATEFLAAAKVVVPVTESDLVAQLAATLQRSEAQRCHDIERQQAYFQDHLSLGSLESLNEMWPSLPQSYRPRLSEACRKWLENPSLETLLNWHAQKERVTHR